MPTTRTPTGPPPAPVVQRLRVRYARRGRLRFASHRDFQRALERALRRAEVPVAFSAGFTPHPRISYAGAAPTGTASEAEYLELALAQRREPSAVHAALARALPAGFDVCEVVEAHTPDLAARLEVSVWEVRLPGVPDEVAAAALAAFLGRDAVAVDRLTKDGVRRLDARAAVVTAELVRRAAPAGVPESRVACAILNLVVRHSVPAVRPDDVLAGLRLVAGLEPPAPPVVTRCAQGPLDARTGVVADPLAPDREAAPTADGVAPAEPVDAVVGTPPRS